MWSSLRSLGCVSLFSLFAGCSDGTVENLNDDESPAAAAESARACALDWTIDNAVTCLVPPTVTSPPLIYSSHVNGDNEAACERYTKFPQPVPKDAWSTQHVVGLTAGSATACFSLKQGDFKNPTAGDCVLNRQCFDVEYKTPEAPLDLPPLAPWSADDETCARAYYEKGGYVELRITSDDLGCGEEGADVKRLPLCPPRCEGSTEGAGCEDCVDNPSVSGAF